MTLPIHRFAEVRDGPNRVAVAWRANLLGTVTHVEATFDGRRLAADPRRPGDGSAWVFRLPDGRMLTVRMVMAHLFLMLPDVRIDGRPLPMSAYDRNRYLLRTGQVLAVFALFHLTFTTVWWNADTPRGVTRVSAWALNFAAGLTYPVAALWMRRWPRPAATAAIVGFACTLTGACLVPKAACCSISIDAVVLVLAIEVLLRFREPPAGALGSSIRSGPEDR